MLYDCETWSFTLREECRLRVFENRILRRIFGPMRGENGEWRRLHNEELLVRRFGLVDENALEVVHLSSSFFLM